MSEELVESIYSAWKRSKGWFGGGLSDSYHRSLKVENEPKVAAQPDTEPTENDGGTSEP